MTLSIFQTIISITIIQIMIPIDNYDFNMSQKRALKKDRLETNIGL